LRETPIFSPKILQKSPRIVIITSTPGFGRQAVSDGPLHPDAAAVAEEVPAGCGHDLKSGQTRNRAFDALKKNVYLAFIFLSSSSSSCMDRRESHVAAGQCGRLGLQDRPLTVSPKLKAPLSGQTRKQNI
jgi:hypothetical protein